MPRRARFWPAYAVLALLLVALAAIWSAPGAEDARQGRVVATMTALLVAALAFLAWWVLFSNLSLRLRLAGVLGVALAGGIFAAVFTMRGFTGDLVPVLALRWGGADAPPPSAAPGFLASPPSPAPGPPADPVPSARVLRSAAPAPFPPARGDFPQFQGPTRDGVVRGVRLRRDWAAHPPRLLWRRRVGEGWSGFAVSGSLAVTQEQHGGEERVTAYDVATGRPRWSHGDPVRYSTFIGGTGPRATPAIDGGRVFTMGATGILNAFDLATGRRRWSRDVVEENDATPPQWGKSSSPLVLEGRVIVSAGGAAGRSLVAYDARTGTPIWSGGHDRSAYSSPVLLVLDGQRQIVIFNGRTVAGHHPQTGALLWDHPWPPGAENIALPVVLPGGRLLVSTGYGHGSKAFRVSRTADGSWRALLEWESPRLKSKFANIVVHEGWVYGLDEGVLTCIDPATGERKWKGGRYGHGQLLLVEDVLLVQTEEGELVLVEPSPEGPRELTRFAVLEGRTWNPPALAGPLLVVRNEREAAAYELPVLR